MSAGAGGALLLLLAAPAAGCAAASRTAAPAAPLVIYVVRHAEKVVAEGDRDPPLTEVGRTRAEALARALPLPKVVAIYSTDTRRTRATVEPAARATGIAVSIYNPEDYGSLVGAVKKHARGAIVISGHSNTVPALLLALGVRDRVEIPDDRYGDLFEVTLEEGGASMKRLRYGSP